MTSQTLTVGGLPINLRAAERRPGLPDVLFLMTPLASVDEALAGSFVTSLAPSCNLCLMDLPGLGKSGGGPRAFTWPRVKAAVAAVTDHLQQSGATDLHLYGGTGTGGVLAQCIASDPDLGPRFRSFSQYGCAVHGDASFMGSTMGMRILRPLVAVLSRVAPGLRFPFREPAWSGLNAEREAEWYDRLRTAYPGCFDVSVPIAATLLWLVFGRTSPLAGRPLPPTLVLAARHDRYFAQNYVSRHAARLGPDARLVWFDDSHLCFDWAEAALSAEVAGWISSHRA